MPAGLREAEVLHANRNFRRCGTKNAPNTAKTLNPKPWPRGSESSNRKHSGGIVLSVNSLPRMAFWI